MPSKTDKLKIQGTMYDRRRKLTPQQQEEIRAEYLRGGESWNSLAQKYGVSKKTIGLLVNEDMNNKSKLRIKQHWRDYYDKDRLVENTKDLRHYKKQLHQDGKI